MKRRNTNIHILTPYSDRIPFLCLYLAGMMLFLFLTLGSKFEYTISPIYRLGMLGSCVVFTCSAILQMRQNKTRYPFRLAILMVIWFFVTLVAQFSKGMISHHYTLLPPVYLLALPFAAVARDEKQQTGLKVVAMLFVSAIVFWVLYTVLLMADCLPPSLRNHVGWSGTRLNVFFHSNICARGFMLGIGFSLGLSLQFPQKWAKALLLAAAALMFAALSLTNSRSVVLITCLLVAGTAFFMVCKGSWKHLSIGIAVAVMVASSLLLVSQALFQWNSARLTASQTAPEVSVQQNTAQQLEDTEAAQPSYRVILLSGTDAHPRTAPAATFLHTKAPSAMLLSDVPAETSGAAEHSNGSSKQDSFVSDLPSLNNRTTIWRSAMKRIQEDPSILIWGTTQTELEIWGGTAPHTHNSWLEVLFRMGLPGFVLSLIFTGQALWSSAVLLWHHQADLWKKIISMLALCILICSFFEPSLFFAPYSMHFVDFVFFLCLGYLIQWRKELLR